MNVTSTWTAPSRVVGLWPVAVRMAALTASRQGPTFLDDSIMRPLPTYFFDPCGAGIPWTRTISARSSTPGVITPHRPALPAAGRSPPPATAADCPAWTLRPACPAAAWPRPGSASWTPPTAPGRRRRASSRLTARLFRRRRGLLSQPEHRAVLLGRGLQRVDHPLGLIHGQVVGGAKLPADQPRAHVEPLAAVVDADLAESGHELGPLRWGVGLWSVRWQRWRCGRFGGGTLRLPTSSGRGRLGRAGGPLRGGRPALVGQPGFVVLVCGDPDQRGEAVAAGVADASANHLDAALARDRKLAR